MNKIQRTSLFAGLALLLIQTVSYAAVTSPRPFGKQYATDQILVKFKPAVSASARAQMAQSMGTQTMHAVGNQPDLVLAKLTPGQSVEQAVGAYNSDPNVAYAQPNYIYHALAIPNDPQYGQLWAAKNTGQLITSGTYSQTTRTSGKDMSLESAWSLKTDCRSILVAVVDSGVNYNSTDLAANMWAGNTKHGQNFASDATTGVGSDPMDLNGHGTHVAGIIGSVGNNSIAGTGVCWQANIMAVRVLDATGSGTTSSIIAGINYAVSNSAKIINMSLGGTTFDQAYSDAITAAQTANVLVVVAAGNDNQNNETTPHYPCNFTQSNLICVAALDQNYDLASFSDYGSTSVDVGAPGTNIYSTWAGTSTVAYTDITSGFAAAGWIATTTTSGGWAADALGYLVNPAGTWNTTLYNVNTDDRVYRTFNLAGVNAAYLEVYASINVENGDYFKLNYMNTAGDPFAGGGTTAASITNWHDEDGNGYLYASGKINITPCIGAACTLGFQLKSDTDSLVDIGVAMTTLTITTMTNNSTSYNTINGTSMATPEVAGIAALVWAYNPSYTYADVANAVKNGGRSVTSLSTKTTTGKAVDALGALTYINKPTGVAVVVH